ncbi:MAG: VanZ family protein, partial [Lachnospiraceae bacterium]|nr:VanZ family protein [Lachnospiraceae bacterium]
MKKNVLKNWNLWACIPIPAIMLMILYFTLQPGDVTTVTSGAVADKVYRVLDGNKNPLDVYQKNLLNTYTRVFAHMTEFALLSAAVGLAASANGIRRYLRSIYMFCFCLPVAVTDEII